jgi:hypothetical protein
MFPRLGALNTLKDNVIILTVGPKIKKNRYILSIFQHFLTLKAIHYKSGNLLIRGFPLDVTTSQ